MSDVARYFVFERNGKWLVTLDGAPVGRHPNRPSALNSAIVMADLMGSMKHESDVMVEDGDTLSVAWTYGVDAVPVHGAAAA
jgi:hypothetical protein